MPCQTRMDWEAVSICRMAGSSRAMAAASWSWRCSEAARIGSARSELADGCSRREVHGTGQAVEHVGSERAIAAEELIELERGNTCRGRDLGKLSPALMNSAAEVSRQCVLGAGLAHATAQIEQ